MPSVPSLPCPQAMEATQKVAAELKISKKVNYAALKQLLGGGSDDGSGDGDGDGSGDDAGDDAGDDGDADW